MGFFLSDSREKGLLTRIKNLAKSSHTRPGGGGTLVKKRFNVRIKKTWLYFRFLTKKSDYVDDLNCEPTWPCGLSKRERKKKKKVFSWI